MSEEDPIDGDGPGGDPQLEPQPVSVGRVTMRLLAEPQSSNIFGSVHGGWILRQVDQAAYVCAARHAGHQAVTASIDRVDFRSPIHIGDLVTLRAEVHYVGHTSMVIGVCVEAEDLLSTEIRHTNTCVLTFVAIDHDFHPTGVPGLLRETDDEERLWREARERRNRT